MQFVNLYCNFSADIKNLAFAASIMRFLNLVGSSTLSSHFFQISEKTKGNCATAGQIQESIIMLAAKAKFLY